MKTTLVVCLAVMFVLMAGCIENPGGQQVATVAVDPIETTMESPVVATQSETPTPTPTITYDGSSDGMHKRTYSEDRTELSTNVTPLYCNGDADIVITDCAMIQGNYSYTLIGGYQVTKKDVVYVNITGTISPSLPSHTIVIKVYDANKNKIRQYGDGYSYNTHNYGGLAAYQRQFGIDPNKRQPYSFQYTGIDRVDLSEIAYFSVDIKRDGNGGAD